jgi:hypothetical protein
VQNIPAGTWRRHARVVEIEWSIAVYGSPIIPVRTRSSAAASRVILRREAPKGSLSIQGFSCLGAKAIPSLASLAQDDARSATASRATSKSNVARLLAE